MRRALVCAALVVVGCDDEVVGFAQSSETSGGSTSTDVATSEGTSSSGEGSSSTTAAESSSSTGSLQQGLPDFIAYGREAGLALSFDDGASWQDSDALDAMPFREGAVRGEERLVVVGGEHSAVTTDGGAWTISPPLGLGYARDVEYGSGGFAAVGLDHLAWSSDGESWDDARGGATGFDLLAVAYGNERFVAVGVDQMATSTDGQAWTTTAIPGEKLHAVAFGAGRFVAVGETGRIVETTDGETLVQDTPSGMGSLGEVHYCTDRFAIGADGMFWFSDDAATWTEAATGSQGAFACSGSSWVIVKDEGLFHGPAVQGLMLAHTPPQVLFEAEFTGEP